MDSTSSTTSMDFWRPQVMHLEPREARKTWGYAGCSDMQRKKTYWRILLVTVGKEKPKWESVLKKKNWVYLLRVKIAYGSLDGA
jgi:hypothetical protein